MSVNSKYLEKCNSLFLSGLEQNDKASQQSCEQYQAELDSNMCKKMPQRSAKTMLEKKARIQNDAKGMLSEYMELLQSHENHIRLEQETGKEFDKLQQENSELKSDMKNLETRNLEAIKNIDAINKHLRVKERYTKDCETYETEIETKNIDLTIGHFGKKKGK